MGIFDRNKHRNGAGFTIVELLVVIGVIGILVGLVAVYYPNYQMRTRNSERKSDLSQLATALNGYALQKNNHVGPGSGCGFLGDGSGWLNLNNDNSGGWYPKSIPKCLQEAGLLKTEDDIIDPTGCRSDTGGICGTYLTSPTTAYMKASCTKNGQPIVYVMAHLEGEPRKDAEVDALCDTNSIAWFNPTSQKWGTNYGMNYWVVVK